MTHTSFLIEALNDLIKVNNDRIAGYSLAVNKMDSSDMELKEACQYIVNEGRKNVSELINHLNNISSQQPVSSARNGKVFQLWKDVTEADANTDETPSFASCVCSEDAVQKMYEETLLTYAFMPAELRATITQQKRSIAQAKKIIMNHLQTNRAVA